MINEFTKVTGYKINIQKLFTFLYTNNKVSDSEIRKIRMLFDCIKNNSIPRDTFNQKGKKNPFT